MYSKDNPERFRKEFKLKDFKLIDFKGAIISKFEVDILQEIETLTNLEFSKIEKIMYGIRMGFIAEKNLVTGIRLHNCVLSTLPESILKLSSLKELLLNDNHFKVLPDIIYKLRSLETLYLRDNFLCTLPESIGNLKSLKSL
ncbi:MAG: hypothetical protein ACFFAO_11725, partial [Candidatus Hermodarchaeota archaeon]